jgi:hypothetical protein
MSDATLKFDSKTFAAQLHTQFKVHTGDGASTVMELFEVLEPQAPPQVELFCLHFRGPRAPRLAQRIHRFEHEKLGAFDLFITAIGTDERGIAYEAVFNRMRKPQA